jgi:hypothetical protein
MNNVRNEFHERWRIYMLIAALAVAAVIIIWLR